MELGRFGWGRFVAVGVAVGLMVGLAAFGLIGAGNRAERFDAKQVLVQPIGDDGVRIREVVDQDFGSNDRRGYQRIIPNDFGVPTDVVAFSPDAPDDVSVVALNSFETRIRIGDPDTTITGQHRYVLEYTLPEARISTGELALDVIGTIEELETGRFEVLVTGMELDGPLCNVGSVGTSGGCTLDRDPSAAQPLYRTVIEPLRPGEGITIGGTIRALTPPVAVGIPEIPERREDNRLLAALLMIPLGVIGPAIAFVRMRKSGSNEVFAGGAAQAAYGQLPAPGADGTAPAVATVLVADDKMDDLATIEFVPPKGLRPWEGRALLTERVDQGTVAAWFSDMIAREALLIDDSGKKPVLGLGPAWSTLEYTERQHLQALFSGRDEITLGKYDPKMAALWQAIAADQRERVKTSGWWTRLPAVGTGGAGGVIGAAVLIVVIAFGGGGLLISGLSLFASLPAALLLGVIVPTVVSLVAFSGMSPARSATGSALALRTESFRRFLDKSEGQHVEWAWNNGVLREYSAWAAALDEAEAWNRALERANVPEATRHSMSQPLLLGAIGSSLVSSRTPPSSSGGGGGGGGGSVGGGGGGGSSGSW
jgi:uncharacterized membrane protein YgcG